MDDPRVFTMRLMPTPTDAVHERAWRGAYTAGDGRSYRS
jgi:hypothetical protein